MCVQWTYQNNKGQYRYWWWLWRKIVLHFTNSHWKCSSWWLNHARRNFWTNFAYVGLQQLRLVIFRRRDFWRRDFRRRDFWREIFRWEIWPAILYSIFAYKTFHFCKNIKLIGFFIWVSSRNDEKNIINFSKKYFLDNFIIKDSFYNSNGSKCY